MLKLRAMLFDTPQRSYDVSQRLYQRISSSKKATLSNMVKRLRRTSKRKVETKTCLVL
jgi:hypothetical protein